MDAFLATLKNTTHSFLCFRKQFVFGLTSQHIKFTLGIAWDDSEVDFRYYDGATFADCVALYNADIRLEAEMDLENSRQMQQDSEDSDQNEREEYPM